MVSVKKMRTARLRSILLSFIGVSVLLFQPSSLPAALITDVRFWSAPDHTRIVLDLTESVQYESSTIKEPPECHVELKGANLFTTKRELQVNDPYVSRISLIQLAEDKVRLILRQRKPLSVDIFPLKPYLDKPHRLVIHLVDLTQEKKDQEERQRQKEKSPHGTKIVVIDPGHGGEDPGAIGPNKTMEKDVVLKVGEKLIQRLSQNKDIQAFLTRKGDYFIPLEQRIKIAREYGADLFISLHADGSFNPHARGSSVYCLSLSGATDEAARLLADKENLSNILGGASLRPASLAKDPNLSQILLDLMQNKSLKESFRMAEYLLRDIKEVNQLKYPCYRQANFIVLRGPYFPSLLIELAFITNKEDERLLNRSRFQEKMAQAIATSIKTYFKQ
ncbi:MAG: N-acetylmuramoyl-L-alanine amidase [Syntrophaceae bacterium]|nr:N-acetylmuramoyl-L-alanine amidase [Syntrophaceae bacterium]